jgi:hypothetical protein
VLCPRSSSSPSEQSTKMLSMVIEVDETRRREGCGGREERRGGKKGRKEGRPKRKDLSNARAKEGKGETYSDIVKAAGFETEKP